MNLVNQSQILDVNNQSTKYSINQIFQEYLFKQKYNKTLETFNKETTESEIKNHSKMDDEL